MKALGKPRAFLMGSGKSVVGSWESEVGSRKLEVGSWKLEVGSWKLEVGSWKLEVGSWKLIYKRINAKRINKYSTKYLNIFKLAVAVGSSHLNIYIIQPIIESTNNLNQLNSFLLSRASET